MHYVRWTLPLVALIAYSGACDRLASAPPTVPLQTLIPEGSVWLDREEIGKEFQKLAGRRVVVPISRTALSPYAQGMRATGGCLIGNFRVNGKTAYVTLSVEAFLYDSETRRANAATAGSAFRVEGRLESAETVEQIAELANNDQIADPIIIRCTLQDGVFK